MFYKNITACFKSLTQPHTLWNLILHCENIFTVITRPFNIVLALHFFSNEETPDPGIFPHTGLSQGHQMT
jgi:hypothetical protein